MLTARAAGPPRYDVALRSAEFAGAGPAPVPLAQYRAAEPDPLWRQAPGILRHLGDGHMAELIACARAHGLREAEWVTLISLDRFGLRLLVFTSAASPARGAVPASHISLTGMAAAPPGGHPRRTGGVTHVIAQDLV